MSADPQDNPPDKLENCPHPRDTHQLFGHEAAENAFLQAAQANKLHHAWLIQGPKGCGKASLAYRMARTLLGAKADQQNGILGVDVADPISRQISVGSFADLMVITKGWNEKTKKWRTEISVDQVRKISKLFANRAAQNGWRICIIDCADDLNHNAANALLKTLEEPPEKGLLILICHQPEKLLATIRSRCRSLKLRNPSVQIAQQVAIDCGADDAQALAAAQLAKGSPGRAAQIANADGGRLSDEINQIFQSLPKLDRDRAHNLANRLAGKNAMQSLVLFIDLLQIRHQKHIQELALAADYQQIDPWMQALEANRVLQNDLLRINLDPAISVMQMLLNLSQAAKSSPLQTVDG